MSRVSSTQYDVYGESRRQGVIQDSATRTIVSSTVTRSDLIRRPSNWKKGDFAKPLPYAASGWSADILEGHLQVWRPTNGGETWTHSGNLGYRNSWPLMSVDSAQVNALMPTDNDVSVAVIKARNNVADRVASFGESFVELRSTINGLAQNARTIDSFLMYASRKQWRKAASTLGIRVADRRYKSVVQKLVKQGGSVGNAWLGFQFGLAPVVSDMVSALILLSGEWSTRTTGKTVYMTKLPTKKTASSVWFPGGDQTAVRWFTVSEYKAGVFTRLDYQLDSQWLRNFSKFGVLDPLQVGWAVVPYSFLVDFVVPVSEVLRSISATVGLQFLGGSSTRFASISRWSENLRAEVPSDCRLEVSQLRDMSCIGKGMDRIVYSSDPLPVTLYIRDPFDFFKVTTAFALLGKRLSNLFT